MKPDYETLISQSILLPVVGRRQLSVSVLTRLFERLAFYRRQYRTRRQLRMLTVAQLRDVGITIAQAEVETKKFFWES